jgi:hypothetical protein
MLFRAASRTEGNAPPRDRQKSEPMIAAFRHRSSLCHFLAFEVEISSTVTDEELGEALRRAWASCA